MSANDIKTCSYSFWPLGETFFMEVVSFGGKYDQEFRTCHCLSYN